MPAVAMVLRALGLGDFVTGLPALSLIRSALPEHHLVLAAPGVFASLLPYGVDVDEIVATAELEPIPWTAPVDVAIDLHGNGPASRSLLAALAPGTLIGFGNPAAGLPGPVWHPAENEVRRWCRLAAVGLGVTGDCPPLAGRLMVPDRPVPAGVVIVHPGAAFGSRRWPAERFTAVARVLRERGNDVVVTGSAAERKLVAEVASGSGAATLCGASLPELFALVARARLLISGDTGVSHVASAYGTPSVVLMGPVSPNSWGPPPHPRHRVIWHGDGTGDPHGSRVDPALRRITCDEVLAATGRLLEG